jgi:hypothetical protein
MYCSICALLRADYYFPTQESKSAHCERRCPPRPLEDLRTCPSRGVQCVTQLQASAGDDGAHRGVCQRAPASCIVHCELIHPLRSEDVLGYQQLVLYQICFWHLRVTCFRGQSVVPSKARMTNFHISKKQQALKGLKAAGKVFASICFHALIKR